MDGYAGADFWGAQPDDQATKWKGIPYATPPILPDYQAPQLSFPTLGNAPPKPDLETAIRTEAGKQPQWKDYAPPQPHGWGKFGHAVASLWPQTNEYFNLAPQARAAAQYGAAGKEYDERFNQAMKIAQEGREERQQKSTEELHKAQANQFGMVPVTVPWSDEPVYMTQKGAEAFEKQRQAGTTAEDITGKKTASAEKIAGMKQQNARHQIRVMGDGTYEEMEPGKWTRIGAAPPRSEQGNYTPIYNPDTGDFEGWVNPKSRQFLGPNEIGGGGGPQGGGPQGGGLPTGGTPAKPSGATQTRRDQAKVIGNAGNGLIGTINGHRDKVGNVEAIFNSAFLGTPIADPETSGIAAELASFAALQPAMHGFRGQQALKEFEKIIGGVPKDADALIAAIQGIMKTAGYVQGKPTEQGGGTPKSFKEWKAKQGG
jgi:hypothetical protein